MNSEKINTVYHCDDLYIDYTLVSIFSAHCHNKDISFNVITNCSARNKKKIVDVSKKHNIDITIYSVNSLLFDNFNIPQRFRRLIRRHPIKPLYEITKHEYLNEIPFTAAPLFYFVFHPYLFNFKKYIYLDCDTIINCDLRELYDIDLQSKIIAMCEDWSRKYITYKGIKYRAYNGGVYVCKAKPCSLIWEKMYDHVLDNLEWSKLGMQHSMNVIIHDIVQRIDSKWNMSVKHLSGTPKIYHYNTIIKNPKLKDKLYKKYEDSCYR